MAKRNAQGSGSIRKDLTAVGRHAIQRGATRVQGNRYKSPFMVKRRRKCGKSSNRVSVAINEGAYVEPSKLTLGA